MKYTLPHTIKNASGETIIFKEIIREADGDKILIEGHVEPECGPPMHTHYRQDEGLTVKKGRMGYQVLGGEKQYAEEGESAVFKRGTPHKFWNAGDTEMITEGWAKPADNIVFFLSSIYAAQLKSGSDRPEAFDAAYLTKKYKGEYDMAELPSFVKNIVMPVTYQLGKLLGKYKKFKDAPAPL